MGQDEIPVNQRGLPYRAAWFRRHVSVPETRPIFAFARSRGASDPTSEASLERLSIEDASEVGAMQDEFDRGTR